MLKRPCSIATGACALLFVCSVTLANAQPDTTAVFVDTTAAAVDTTATQSRGMAFIPAIFYTPETELAAGAVVLFFFRGKHQPPTARPSTISTTLIFTQKNQIIASVGTEVFFAEERWRLNGGFGYIKFPNKFFGIGPDTPDELEEDYTPRSAFLSATLQRVFHGRFGVGAQYEYADQEISDTKAGGLLESGTIPGSEGGTISGVGGVLTWDSRDNLFYPARGSLHSVAALAFASELGSDFDFERYIVHLRAYRSLLEKNVFAFEAFFAFTRGSPPFQMMPQLGGARRMRGYFEGRYRDRNAIVLQAEWRRRLFWRLGAVVFGGLGDVAPRVGDFDLSSFKESVGVGLRFLLDRDEQINIRVDYGFVGGTPGPYITINEAF